MEARELPRVRGELENFAKDVIEYYHKTALVYPPNLSTTAKRIAEISFKAGYEQKCFETYEMGVKRGERIVVEWMNKNCLGCQSNTPSNTDEYLGFHKESWQAKLKEWGLWK